MLIQWFCLDSIFKAPVGNSLSIGMGQQDSTTDTFEDALGQGRQLLAKARDEYGALEGTRTVPEELVEAIGDLERELDELDQTLEVTSEHVALANEATRRIALLANILAALRNHQRSTVEVDIARLDTLLTRLASEIRQQDLEIDVEPPLKDIERKFSMLQRLVTNGRYSKVVTNDRISPSAVDLSIRQILAVLEARGTAQRRAKTCMHISAELLDEIHSWLADLGAENDARTAYQPNLQDVKELLADIERLVEDGDADAGAHKARVALEGCLMLHYAVGRAHARQQLTTELASIIRETDAVGDNNVDDCVARGDMDELLTMLSETIASQVELSTGERLRQLLEEHDGSVSRTAAATNFDISTIMTHLTQMYKSGHVDDITVEFDE